MNYIHALMIVLRHKKSPAYELIDFGNGEKIERFGDIILIRPEPKAHDSPAIPRKEWEAVTHGHFLQKSVTSGEWKRSREIPEEWMVNYRLGINDIKIILRLTGFKNIGLFPEQLLNWIYIYEHVSKSQDRPFRFLNLFAYTGGASLAAKAAGADVVHLDSLRKHINWAKENMESSGLNGIRWVIEDAMKFCRREVKRGNKYDGIILDPPAFGKGPGGENWVYEKSMDPLLEAIDQLFTDNRQLFILNAYTGGGSVSSVKDSLEPFRRLRSSIVDEMYIESASGNLLPAGICARKVQ